MTKKTVQCSLLLKKENAHDDPIFCCAWATTAPTERDPPKDVIVTGGLDCTVKVWSLVNHNLELMYTLDGHTMSIVSVAVSPDGHTLASSSMDSTLIIWDLETGTQVHTVETEATDVWNVTFSPDGQYVATGSHTGKVALYSVQKGNLERCLDTRGRATLCVAWSADNKYIASGSIDGTLSIFDVAQGKLVHSVPAHSETVRSVVFSPDSQLVATASNDGTLKIHRVASGGAVASSPDTGAAGAAGGAGWALGAAWSPGGRLLAAAGADGGVRVLGVDGVEHHTFREHADAAWGVSFNAKGSRLMSVSKDKRINIYECI